MHLLPIRDQNASTQMAWDALMFFHYPDPGVPRFRHYGWEGRNGTFGFAQLWAEVTTEREADFDFFCRRATGGGFVDHRNDWTYCLVVPPELPLAQTGLATEAYRLLHGALADALNASGCPAVLQPVPDGKRSRAEACFSQAEPFDVVDPASGRKIAGAAMKRKRGFGLLVQGSIDRAACPVPLEDAFLEAAAESMASLLNSPLQPVGWPSWPADREEETVSQYDSDLWNRRR